MQSLKRNPQEEGDTEKEAKKQKQNSDLQLDHSESNESTVNQEELEIDNLPEIDEKDENENQYRPEIFSLDENILEEENILFNCGDMYLYIPDDFVSPFISSTIFLTLL